jgi:hypothetical protein
MNRNAEWVEDEGRWGGEGIHEGQQNGQGFLRRVQLVPAVGPINDVADGG